MEKVIHNSLKQALFAFQQEDIKIPKRGTGKIDHKEYNYALLEDIITITKPYLLKHGLGYTQISSDDSLITTLYSINVEENIKSTIKFGSPVNIHDLGSRITHLRRYELLTILGLYGETFAGETPVEPVNPVVDIANLTELANEQMGPFTPSEVNIGVPGGTPPVVEPKIITTPIILERSASYNNAEAAINSCNQPEALEAIAAQINRSTMLKEEEKNDLKVLLAQKDHEINGTITIE